nr:helix-turn-helix domain-containing protein [Bacteroides fragilis]
MELILIYIIILFIRYHRKYRKKTSVPAADTAEPAPHIIETIPVGSSVETEKQTNSTIKEELSLKDQFVFEKDFVLFNNHPIKMPNQQQKILTFFLNSPNYRINKSDLKKEFWPQNADPTNNMTSAINKLKRILEEIGSKYTIITDKKNEECYILVDDKTT